MRLSYLDHVLIPIVCPLQNSTAFPNRQYYKCTECEIIFFVDDNNVRASAVNDESLSLSVYNLSCADILIRDIIT